MLHHNIVNSNYGTEISQAALWRLYEVVLQSISYMKRFTKNTGSWNLSFKTTACTLHGPQSRATTCLPWKFAWKIKRRNPDPEREGNSVTWIWNEIHYLQLSTLDLWRHAQIHINKNLYMVCVYICTHTPPISTNQDGKIPFPKPVDPENNRPGHQVKDLSQQK